MNRQTGFTLIELISEMKIGQLIKKQQGFTLVELIAVMVIIGVLSAVAMPRFVNLLTGAQTAANQGFYGQFGSSLMTVHSAWLAQSGGTAVSATLSLTEGSIVTSVHVNTNGWPDGTPNMGIVATGAGCASIPALILNNPPVVVTSPSTCSTTDPTCYVASSATSICTYTLNGTSGARTITYNLSNGDLTIT